MSLRLRTAFRPGPHVQALLDGRVRSERIELEFTPVEPISRAFRRAIRDEEFDVSEMALVTLAMAHDAGKPWMGLPVVLLRGFHHGALKTQVDSEIRGPRYLIGKAVGVRAYSQTTGVWVRGILESEHGVKPDEIRWITCEDAHVEGFRDPEFVSRAAKGKTLAGLLAAGEIAAAIGDSTTHFEETRSVIADAGAAAGEWFRRTGVVPVNHVIAVRRDLAREHGWLREELLALFEAARQMWLKDATTAPKDVLPYGRDAHERSIDLGLQFSYAQQLTRMQYGYAELF